MCSSLLSFQLPDSAIFQMMAEMGSASGGGAGPSGIDDDGDDSDDDGPPPLEDAESAK